MAQRLGNPFQAQTQLGQSISNLGAAIFGGRQSPSEIEKQDAETALLRARTNSLENKARLDAAALTGQQTIATLLGQVPDQRRATVAPVVDPGVAGPARALAATGAENIRGDARQSLGDLPAKLASAGASFTDSPDKLADLFRFMQANSPGVSDNDVIRAAAGAGTFIGKDQAASLPGQDRVRADNVAGDIAVNDAKPRTLSQVQAEAFNRLDPGTQATTVGPSLTEVQGSFANKNVDNIDGLSPANQSFISAQPTTPAPRNYATPDGARGITRDGITDAQTGAEIPPGSSVFSGQVQAGDAGSLAGTDDAENRKTRAGVFEGRVKAKQALGIIGELDQITARDGAALALGGIGGIAARVSGLRSQAEALFKAEGVAIETTLDQELFADQLQALGARSAEAKSAIMDLAFSIATAREGGRLTDQDIARALETLGASYSDPALFRIALRRTAERIVRDEQITRQTVLESVANNPNAFPNIRSLTDLANPMGVDPDQTRADRVPDGGNSGVITLEVERGPDGKLRALPK